MLGVCLLAAVLGACSRRADRPNIVLLIADDLDVENAGFMGNPIAHTPRLDRLAEEGLVFTTVHVQPRCRPTLACLLSGRYPHQTGITYNQGPRELDAPDALPRLLRDAGYATFAGGKFWEGSPERLGFEHAQVDERATLEGLAPASEKEHRAFVRSGQQELLAFVEQFAGKQPLFIWWAPSLPHAPHDAPQRFFDLFRSDDIPLPPWFERFPAAPEIYRQFEHKALAMGAWLDEAAGELIDALKAEGAYEDTLFVFLTDNGWSTGLVSKGSPFEKGIKSPVVFSWAGHIPAAHRSDALASVVDVHATLLDYAGVPLPSSAEGRSLRAVLEGRASEVRDVLCGAVYDRHAPDDTRPERDAYALYARDRRWKYVLYLKDVGPATWDIMLVKPLNPLDRARGDEDLFDLESDPYELTDLAGDPAQRETMDRLKASALAWWRDTGGRELDLP